jgi:hypothetical protein
MTQIEAMMELMEAPRGAVMQVPDSPYTYWVRGTQNVYEVVLAQPDREEIDYCECPGYHYRGTCAHLTAATRKHQGVRPLVLEYTQDELRKMFA